MTLRSLSSLCVFFEGKCGSLRGTTRSTPSRRGLERWAFQSDSEASREGRFRFRSFLKVCGAFFCALWILGMGDLSWGATKVWEVGRGGLSWSSQRKTSSGVMFDGEVLRPNEISFEENICLGLEWVNGRPEDFTVGGKAHVWDNAAFGGSDLILVDGRDTTSTEDRFQKEVSQAGRAFFFDLGAAHPVRRIVFYPSPGEEDYFIQAFEILSSDGESFDDIGQPIYELLKRVEVNLEPRVDLVFPVALIRFLQLKTLSRDAFELAEFEVYGEGFVPKASYLSELHEFDEGPVNFGDLVLTATRLAQDAGESGGASALLQVRSGTDDTPLIYYRRDHETRIEEEVSEQEYDKFPKWEENVLWEKGAIREDAEHWSPWSVPVRMDSTGRSVVPLDLPSPRGLFQFRIAFEGTAADAMQIEALSVAYSDPLASAAVGEVALSGMPDPPEGVATVPVGADTSFTYDIHAEFEVSGLEGFDGIRIAAPSTPRFLRLEMGDPLEEVHTDSLVVDSTGFVVYFPRITENSNQPIRVTLRTMLVMYATTIRAWLVSSREGLSQPVLAGDANKRVKTNALQVFGSEMKPSVSVTLSSPGITPDGDGRNDEVGISHVIAQFWREVRVRLELYDLSGARVKELFSGWQSPGRYESVWDGTDEEGERVPPGIYLCRISVETDAKTFRTLKRIAVVY